MAVVTWLSASVAWAYVFFACRKKIKTWLSWHRCPLLRPVPVSKNCYLLVATVLIWTLRGDKVSTSTSTHTNPHKPPRKTKVIICNHQADSQFYVRPDIWSGDLQVKKKYAHTWHRMSSLRPGVIKQHIPNQTPVRWCEHTLFPQVSDQARLTC